MAHEVATESVEAVRFGFMTDEEVKKLSVQKITDAILMDAVGRPLPGGLYDPAMGPLDEGANCKSCGQRAYICPGHFGHIDLVSVVYNPLLFNTLVKLLRRTCFHCCHFTADREEVQYYVSKLKLVARGDIIGARMIAPKSEYSCIQDISEDGLSGTDEVHVKKGDDQVWTSLQQDEARSALNEFLGKRSRKCLNCSTKTATLSKPTFGWIQRSGVFEAFLNGDDDKPSSEVENSDIEEVISSIAPADGEQRSSKPQKRIKNDSQIEIPGQKNAATSPLLPSQARNILRRLWENEAELCSFICDISQEHKCAARKTSGYSMFFLKTLPVPPSKFRPPARTGDSVMEHPQTMLLGKILESNLYLGNALEQRAIDSVFIRRLMLLQQSINVYFDSKTSVGKAEKEATGICQLLEKKEGIFRQKMMGKRVNFACRSVISPDPYLAVNEIGIPPAFALKLTYPERITPWNVMKLRDAVINGPDNHPGATHYADRMGSIKLLSTNTRIALSRKLASSRGAVSQLGKNTNCEFEGKVIQRHIRNGDAVLANRQPTLHKPSICGFRARILPGEKTLRMHYVNCDSFNADFDGDEINVHLPQDEISRAETYNIVNADYQYIVPTRGDPKRALIQDHIVSAVLLTKRDTFLTYTEFNQLLYSSGMSGSSAWSVDVKPGKKVSVIESEDLIESLPPAIVKPHRLWTGKQIISAILKHITKGERFTVKKRAKIAREYFGADESKKRHREELSKKNSKHSARKNKVSSLKIIEGDPTENTDEDTVFVFKNELVQGVIDKEQFGKYGLVHTVQELFGSSAAGNLLSILSRVLTAFLQLHGFTCGVDDILLVQDYEHRRKQLLDACLHCGEEVHQQFIGSNNSAKDSNEMQVEIEKAILRNGEPAVALLDAMMRNKLNSSSSALSKLFPDGLTKPFRKNCLSLMTLSGAKGGTFNFQQISILLGQQELEGKRVPRMVSGKTLPCFPSWDTASRAGGFISDRYLTGLRPQEFYFHCMAGREGLVDTAVKTSRSGYLQRCLVKNLESLKVHYDYTVRDADGSIVQFFYGEDGVDVHQKNFLQEFDALALNKKIVEKNLLTKDVDVCVSVYAEEDNEYPSELARKTNDFLNDEKRAKSYGIGRKKDRSKFVQMVKNKYFLSLAQPGEPVGIIAAQSIGEPSTQMTLNTFHHAGRGEMNVTLGIPRLQEILMTASAIIKTPTMTCPLHRFKTSDDAERLAASMRKITVADLIEKMEVCVLPFTVLKHEISSVYKLRIKLYDPKLYPPHTDITLEDCQDVLKYDFMTVMEDSIHRHLLLLSRISGIKNFIADARMNASDETKDDDGDGNKLKKDAESSDDDDANEEGADDLGLDVQKRRQQTTDEMDYEETSRSEHQSADSDEEDESEDGEPKQVKSKPQIGDDDDDEEEDQDLDDGDDGSDDDGDNSNLERKKLAFEVDSEIDQAEHEDKEGTMNTNIPKKESPLRSNSQKQMGNEKLMKKKKPVARQSKKRVDRAIHIECSGTHFEVHFKLVNEPHMLLSELAQKAAKKVCVKSSGKIEQCKVVELHLDDSGSKKAGGIPMLRKGKESRVALQTAGIDFASFWELQDDLDVNYISSNDIHAVLNTYGVEAARAAIITEVFRVFNHYGVSVDMRHLTLVADFMTHAGGYRPLNRIGGIADSTSPFARMTFETASKFIVEASSSGEKDSLETPSARVCLGLPVKVGTGCFDLLHNLEV